MKKRRVALSAISLLFVLIGSVLLSQNGSPPISQAFANAEADDVQRPQAPKHPIAISWDDKRGRVVLKGHIETGSKFWEMYSVLSVECTDKKGDRYLFRCMLGEEWSSDAGTSTHWVAIPDFTFTPEKLRVKSEYVLVYEEPKAEQWYKRAHHAMSIPLGTDGVNHRRWVKDKIPPVAPVQDRSLFDWMQNNKIIENGVSYVFRQEFDMTSREYRRASDGNED